MPPAASPKYYVLHRERGNLAFYGLTAGCVYAPLPLDGRRDDPILRSPVLPGFQFRVNDLIRRPDLDLLRRDPVYSGFLLPEWTRAERAYEQAVQARDDASRERDVATLERDTATRERDAAVAAHRRDAVAQAQAELARLRAALAERGDDPDP